MKNQLLSFLLVIMLISSSSFGVALASAPTNLPEAEVTKLEGETLNAFFNEMDPGIIGIALGWAGVPSAFADPIIDFIKHLYASLENTQTEVYALKFSAKDATDAQKSEYSSWVADFTLETNKTAYALLLGNYTGFGTIPMGFVKLEPGKPCKVMHDAFPGGPVDVAYSDVLAMKDFRCAALLFTEDVVKAIEKYKDQTFVEELKNSGIITDDMLANPAPWNTTLGLSLNLYEPDDDECENGYGIGEELPFHYGDAPVVPAAHSAPRTGDNSLPLLWALLCVAALSTAVIMRKKVYSR